jgi:single-stranded-DNA-specific exonuclease
MIDEATADIAAGGYAELAGIVLARPDWHPGVVGIVAGRIADTFQKPTIVVGLEGVTGRGSVRGPRGFPLHTALTRCRSELVGFGGHQAAAGVHVEASRVEALRAAWHEACREIGEGRVETPSGMPTVRLDPRDDPRAVLADLLRLEPCGEGNPAPRLLLRGAQIRSARNLKGHLKLDLGWGKHAFSAVAFSRGELAPGFSPGERRDLVGTLRANTFQGGVELTISSI